MSKIFYQGTLSQFNSYIDWADDEQNANIPSEGKINYVMDEPAPDNQRTTSYTKAIAHPTIEDQYIWLFGQYQNPSMGLTELTYDEAEAAGYFPDYMIS